MTIEITQDKFDEVIRDNKCVLIDCWAPWCGPCKRLAPVIDEISQEYGDQVTVAKIDLDDAQELAIKYDIQAIPTLLMFKNGALIKTVIGLRPKAEILSEMVDAKLVEPKAPAKEEGQEGAVATVTDDTFDSFVAGPGYALVDCWAPWCGPCRRMGPIVDGLAEVAAGKIKVGKLDTDQNQNTAMRFNIASIPRLLIYKDGKLVETIVGLDPSLTPESLMQRVLGL